jgi:fructose-1,6-bisphosphatase/inositol monophosphatase family enzyme
VIDPIDGTLHSYLQARGPYAVIVGLRVADEFRASILALPREGLFLDAREGAGARKTRPRGAARTVRAEADGRRVLVSHGMPEIVIDRLRSAGFEPASGCGGAVSVAPLIPGVRAGVRVAPDPTGTISTRGRVGLLIAREAGAIVRAGCGADFPSRSTELARTLVVAADGSDLEPLLNALDGA